MKFLSFLVVSAALTGATFGLPAQGAKTQTKQAPRPVAKSADQVSLIRTPIGSSEMSVDLPGKADKMTVPLEEKVRASYDILETVGVAIDRFAAFASYAVSRGNKAISLDGAARGALDRVKGQEGIADYKETITNVLVVGLPARKIQCSFSHGEQKMFLTGLIFTDRTRMWQVICTGEATTNNTNLANRVTSSVRRDPPKN